MKLNVYDIENTKTGEFEMDDKILNINVKDDLIHNVLLAYLNNQHIGSAHTKTRGEVSGGGKKPWRQKGTGRARHGSIRSPIWKGGGVTFGPRAHKVRFKVNKTESKKALQAILSKRIKDNSVVLLKDFNVDVNKTKDAAKVFYKFINDKNKKTLLILEKIDFSLHKVIKNIKWIKMTTAAEVNVYDLFIYDKILITKNAIEKLLARFN